MAQVVGHMPAVTLSAAGLASVKFGRSLGPADAAAGFGPALASALADGSDGHVRLLDEAGTLVAVATPVAASGLLHPAVVLV